MKREEKAKCSKDRIMSAAGEEFSLKSYDAASLNNICNDNEIPKGLIYHYFGNKDDLYLSCVKACFNKFTVFLAEEFYDFSDFQNGMNQYLKRRFLFFRTYPQEGRLFFYAVLQPPRHLMQQIQELKAEFDAQCLCYYKTALTHITLREGITEKSAQDYFVLFQEIFNGYFQRQIGDEVDLDSLMQDHELQLSNILNMMIFGIAKEDGNK